MGWYLYSKVFSFKRDCHSDDLILSNAVAINRLLNLEQVNKEKGAILCTRSLIVNTLVDKFEAYKSEDDGTWDFQFYHENKQIASVSLWDYKEIHLCFDIEENIDTGEFKIHYCTIKDFKDYQI